ncbi:diguanylate cyclase [Pseudomonas sp. UL073]|uniref:diguanylate cyclase n=1 Tax=Zestomonas insulae TaxID=2809017 RepID=A0ABS2IJR3_9GAMM|nr:diguanylate cyclase [Pseudomonas insulae]MBM7062579.1 diguanylate cyclase [Pseudomonas insulae]
MRPVLAVLLWLCLWPPLFAAPAVTRLDAVDGSIAVGPQLEYLLGESQRSFGEVAGTEFAKAWQPNLRATLNLRIQRQGVWVRFAVQRQRDERGPWNLVIRWPLLDRVELRLHYPERDAWSAAQLAGDAVPAETRALPHHLLAFPLDLAPGERATVYLHVSAYEALILPMELVTGERLQLDQLHDSILISLFFGAVLVMLLYNTCLYLFTRERSYAYYVLYLCATLVYCLAITGFGQRYLDLAQPALADRLYSVSGALAFILASLFVRDFLSLARIGGWVDWVNRLNTGYWVVTGLCFLFIPYSRALHWLNPQSLGPASCLLGLLTGVYLWRKGYREARLFTLAWLVLILFTLLNLSALDGRLPLNAFTLNSQLLGMVIEFTLLAIALVAHINHERSARLSAQQTALDYAERLAREREEKLHAQQQALRIQRKANEELEQCVTARTRELAEANVLLARLSTLDPLTQLCNRRHFEARFAEELARAKRSAAPLALLMIDIDHFKSINDRFGHPFGDEALRRVAAVLQAHSQRAGDVAARYGGEEFILLFANTDAGAARLCAERIRAAIAAVQLSQAGQLLSLTASIGLVALVPPLNVSEQSLIALADTALYQAKSEGRNRVVFARDGQVTT